MTGHDEKAWEFYQKAGKNIKNDNRIGIALVESAYRIGQIEFVEQEISKEPQMIQEFDNVYSRVYPSYRMAQLIKKGCSQKQAQAQFEREGIPYEIDFKTS